MQLDPRTKFLTVIMFIVATFSTENVFSFLWITGILGSALFITKTSLRRYVRNLMLLSWLLVVTFFMHLWGRMPDSYDTSVFASSHRFLEGGLALGQLIVVVGWVTMLGTSSSPLELVNGLERLLRPLQRIGLPVQKFSIIALLSMRFIPIVFEEAQNLIHVYIARGIELNKGNITTRLKNSVLLCVPLFHNMIRRVEHVTLAMENRAFQLGAARSSLYELRMRSTDYIVLGLSLGVMIGIINY